VEDRVGNHSHLIHNRVLAVETTIFSYCLNRNMEVVADGPNSRHRAIPDKAD
jgi:hypothetical protein